MSGRWPRLLISLASAAQWVPHFSRSLREVGLFADTLQPSGGWPRLLNLAEISTTVGVPPFGGWPSFLRFPFPIRNVGAPSLRSLQGRVAILLLRYGLSHEV